MLRFLLAVVSTMALLSLSVYIGLAYRGHSAMLYSTALRIGPSWRARIVLVLAALGLLTCLFEGARAMLFWLPPTWGTLDEDGTYQTLATSLAILFASGGIFFLAFIDKATHEKVWLRVTQERADGLTEILQASIDRRTLSYLEDKYQKRIADLTATLDAIPAGSDRDEHVLRQLGPTEERIDVLHELVSAVRKQQKRIEEVGLP